MDFPINVDTFKSGWSVLYIEGSHVIIIIQSQNIIFLSLKISFVLENSDDLDEMPLAWHFIWVFTVFPKYLIFGFWFSKGSRKKNSAIKYDQIYKQACRLSKKKYPYHCPLIVVFNWPEKDCLLTILLNL